MSGECGLRFINGQNNKLAFRENKKSGGTKNKQTIIKRPTARWNNISRMDEVNDCLIVSVHWTGNFCTLKSTLRNEFKKKRKCKSSRIKTHKTNGRQIAGS